MWKINNSFIYRVTTINWFSKLKLIINKYLQTFSCLNKIHHLNKQIQEKICHSKSLQSAHNLVLCQTSNLQTRMSTWSSMLPPVGPRESKSLLAVLHNQPRWTNSALPNFPTSSRLILRKVLRKCKVHSSKLKEHQVSQAPEQSSWMLPTQTRVRAPFRRILTK